MNSNTDREAMNLHCELTEWQQIVDDLNDGVYVPMHEDKASVTAEAINMVRWLSEEVAKASG